MLGSFLVPLEPGLAVALRRAVDVAVRLSPGSGTCLVPWVRSNGAAMASLCRYPSMAAVSHFCRFWFFTARTVSL